MDAWRKYWSQIALVNDPELFRSKTKKDRLASVTKTTPVNLNHLSDSENAFPKWISDRKKLLESISTIKNWNVDFHSYDREKKTLFLEGTFLRGNTTVFFKEWHFHSEQYSLQVLIEDTQTFNETDPDIVSLLEFLKNRD